jgi:4-amino-4-deoxy-L-arabinose transferase-like glycosyltransferase
MASVRRRRRDAVSALLVLLGAALLFRAPFFGNPVIEGDEQFYLLVGDRMLHGLLPYVDRKPVGLFLVYAAVRLLGGEGIWQYQTVAALFAAATAFLVSRIAARFAPRGAAVLAGVTYLAWLGVFGGEGGQSPVFYNLPVALAALLVLRAVAAGGGASGPRLLALGGGAMLAVGVAAQIKYTALFEGVFFGCALLRQGRRSGLGTARLAVFGAGWIVCALLPTAAALASYAALGEADAFLFANFASVFRRDTSAAGSSLERLARMAALASPLLFCAALGRWPRRPPGIAARPEAAGAQDFALAWAAASVLGVLAFGTYYGHYALPVLVPLSAAAAAVLGAPRPGVRVRPAAVLLPLFGLAASLAMATIHARSRGSGAEVRLLAEAVRLRPTECLFVFDGEPILYLLTGSCLPTRYAFPTHLNDLRDAGAIGVDQVAELRRVLATRPAYIVSSDRPRARNTQQGWAEVAAALDRHYRPVLGVRVGDRVRLLHRRLPNDP